VAGFSIWIRDKPDTSMPKYEVPLGRAACRQQGIPEMQAATMGYIAKAFRLQHHQVLFSLVFYP